MYNTLCTEDADLIAIQIFAQNDIIFSHVHFQYIYLCNSCFGLVTLLSYVELQYSDSTYLQKILQVLFMLHLQHIITLLFC